MTKRRVAGSFLIAVLVMTVAGCDYAKVGAKCKLGAPLPRDATHVLYCKNGRWARLVTVEQATQIIIGTLPGSSTVQNATPVTAIVGGGTFTLDVKVLRRNGNVSSDTTVEVSRPASGASVVGTATGKTDASGVARIPLATNGALGSYDLTVKVNGAPDVKVPVTNAPALTLVSGNSDPIGAGGPLRNVVVKATNASGTPLAGIPMTFTSSGDFAVDPATTDAQGLATAVLVGSGKSGTKLTLRATGGGATLDVPFTVTAGTPSSYDQTPGGQNFTMARNSQLTLPVIRFKDRDGNVTPDRSVTYSILQGASSATIVNPFVTTDNGGVTTPVLVVSSNTSGTVRIQVTVANALPSVTYFIVVTP